MKHYSWTYVGDAGYSAKVGVLHSTTTGHLIIYINSKISVIDFKVRDTKTYSIFINDELCEIKLERKGDKMTYNFEINKDADTPRNRARRMVERKHWRQTMLFFGMVAICVTGLFFALKSFKKKSIQANRPTLLTNSLQTIAKVNIDGSSEVPTISYYFIAENNSYSGNPPILLSTGMPLEQGDEFMVEYAPNNPEVNKIRFDKPTEKQVEIYQKRVFDLHQIANPNQTASLIKCQIEVAFELKGLAGLADFYFQNTEPAENKNHNRNTYLRLIQDIPFQKMLEENCL